MQKFLLVPTRVAASVAAMFFFGLVATANANDGVPLETTIKLINGMVDHGALTHEKAEAMIRAAQSRAAMEDAVKSSTVPNVANATPVAPAIPQAELREQIKREVLAEMKGQMADDIKRQVLAELTGVGGANLSAATGGADASPAAPGDKPKSRVVRVPYVPESMRREIRDQLKQEVLAQAKEERWGNPSTLPEWLDRFQFEGDMRLRYESFQLAEDNTPAGLANYVSGTGLTRGADLVNAGGNFSGVPNFNTVQDFNRARLRARFGINAKVNDMVSAGFRITSGTTSGPTSTNQTLGQGFNKYSLVLDRAFLTVKPIPWLSVTGGRIANPFFSTDLVWAEDLNFEGVAANYSRPITPNLTGFVTLGYFPLRTDNPQQTTGRELAGLQTGLAWHLMPTTDFKFGVALYDYHGIEGKLESNTRYGPPSVSDYGTRYEYPNGLRQRGNTLFVTNALADPLTGTTYWGLASGFRELDLTSSVDIAHFDPVHVVLTGDYVNNLLFDHKKISKRADPSGTFKIVDGQSYGYLGKLLVGQPAMLQSGDWNVSLAYRWLGSDAVLDAFTNSDFGLGGTNNKGYILGGSYAIDKNAWISARWMSSDLIDSAAPKVGGSTLAPTKLSVDLLQIDLNAKF
jgi:hypothetical protein